jgi:DNA-binding response OmpR family regulator
VAQGSSLRILVVDDHRDSATSLGMLLRTMGHTVHVAFDGLQAIDVAETHRPDAVLLDIGLPKLNGYDTATRMRSRAWGKRMAVIALSGWGEQADKRRSKEAGFDHHLVKPLDLDALIGLLATVIPNPSDEEAPNRPEPQSWRAT